jgi:hypothetical protein
MSSATLAPAIEAAEKERARLMDQVGQRAAGDDVRVVRMLPEAAGAYRGVVRRLSDARTMLTDAEYIEARGLLFELLGGAVPVHARPDGSASLTLRLDIEPLARANGSMSF